MTTPAPAASVLPTLIARFREALARGFVPFDARDPNAAGYRTKMLHTVHAFAPLTIVMNLVAAAMVGGLFLERLPTWQLIGWEAAIVSMMALAGRAWWKARRPPRQNASTRSIGRLTWRSTVLAAAWGLMLCRIYPQAQSGEGQVVIAIAAGMLCAGGYVLAAVPAAGIAFVVTLGTFSGVSVAMSREPHAVLLLLLLVLYTITICVSIERLSQTFTLRLIAENEAARQQQVVGLLLKDFEDHASDVLWEVDSRGRIRHASSRLLLSFGIEAGGTSDKSFLALLAELVVEETDEANSLKRLTRRFAAGVPFSNESIRLRVHGETRWWGITAKPLIGDDGRINGWRGVISDVTESKTSHSALYKLAHRCPLTGLANRRHFMARIAETLEQLPADAICAILFLDLDNFKKVNDLHGHAMGDTLLKGIAREISGGLRKGDLAARLGGDEFAILLSRIESEEMAAAFAGRLMTRVEPAFRIRDLQLPVGLSIGIAIGPKHGTAPDELMRAADLALYRAKSTGKGSVQVYSPILGREKHRRRVLEEALRVAVRKEQLTVAYQPQVATADGQVVAFEALVRWHHPEQGQISPAEFIPIAEETGLIEELGSWVLRTACRQAMRWPGHIGLAVNVSPVQAMGENLVGSVRRAVAESGLQIKRLEIEITESIFLNEDARTLQNLHELRGMGVKIALDDFGVGYSSLGYLRRFPFNSLKIDRAFTGELATSFQARSIVKAIVTLADCLGMTTIVEGVEHQAQLDVVRDAGCDHFQGFFCSPPVASDAVPGLLRSWAGRAHRDRFRDDRQPEDLPAARKAGGDRKAVAAKSATAAVGNERATHDAAPSAAVKTTPVGDV
ncbi:MAG: EAL domain-containing protein [Burkholderiaceae bacterium]